MNDLEFLKPYGLDNEEGGIAFGIAVLESMGLEEGDRFTEEEFIKASKAFYRGLGSIYSYIKDQDGR